MGEETRFQRTHAPGVCEEDLEYHGHERGSNIAALVIVVASMAVTAVAIVSMLVILNR